MITAITCTGDRHATFKFCEMWMSRQTKQPDQWIIVDDGKTPTEVCYKSDKLVQYVRREPKVDDPPHTLGLNLRTALPRVLWDKIIFIEDDDYYRPDFVEKMDKWLDKSNICGQPNAIYYNIQYRWWHQHSNTSHASLCQTGIRKDLIRFLLPLCEQNLRYVDIDLWRIAQGRHYLDVGDRLCVGLKGLPGRGGIGTGHETQSANDPDYSHFRKLLGEDAAVYLKFLNIVPENFNFPPEVLKCRKDCNGRLILPKPDKRLEAILDKHCTRVEPLAWIIRTCTPRIEVKSFAKKHASRPCYIVGKGPSLDKLKAEHFIDENAPIIAINESIHKVESLAIRNTIYCVQQDSALKETCWSKRGTMLIPHITGAWYEKHPRVCMYSMTDLGGRESFHPQSVIAATRIAKLMGCDKIIYIGFDSYVNKNTDYASCVGYPSTVGGDPNRFIKQYDYLAPELVGYPHEFRDIQIPYSVNSVS
jgi:hypothetical protein